MNSPGNFGEWATDEAGLPCFDLNPNTTVEPDAPLAHLISTGRISAHVDRWGAIRPFTTDGGVGYIDLLPAWRCRSAAYGLLKTARGSWSLLPGLLGSPRSVRYGAGYAVHCGVLNRGDLHIAVKQTVAVSLDETNGFTVSFELCNLGDTAIVGEWSVVGDLVNAQRDAPTDTSAPGESGAGWINAPLQVEELGQIWMVAPVEWQASAVHHHLQLTRPLNLAPKESVQAEIWVGYGLTVAIEQLRLPKQGALIDRVCAAWKERLEPISRLSFPEPWMREEAIWSAAQLLSFVNYDGSVDEYYIALGGYGWRGFGVRECAETAMVIAIWWPGLAQSSLRWLAKLQYGSGDLLKKHDFTRPVPAPASEPYESDNELWFLLGALEALPFIEPGFLETNLPFRDGGSGTFWTHLVRAFQWIRDAIGFGAHGLVKLHRGDWDDFLSRAGAKGRGESIMNSGIACRAFDLLSKTAAARGEDALAAEVAGLSDQLRGALAHAQEDGRFVRVYTDDNLAIGGAEDGTVHINAQSWAVLGRAGSPSQQEGALRTALRDCESPLGLTLASKPYPTPAPAYLSICPLPPGEGENAGVWPQTVYWMVWALAEMGMQDEGWILWKKMSLRNHYNLHPNVPFGIFNAPDCYSSHHAGDREGRTQVALMNRAAATPMNPAVAWQAFAAFKLQQR